MKANFVEDGDAELAGFIEFGAGVFTGHNIIGFFADGAGDFAADGFDELVEGCVHMELGLDVAKLAGVTLATSMKTVAGRASGLSKVVCTFWNETSCRWRA